MENQKMKEMASSKKPTDVTEEGMDEKVIVLHDQYL